MGTNPQKIANQIYRQTKEMLERVIDKKNTEPVRKLIEHNTKMLLKRFFKDEVTHKIDIEVTQEGDIITITPKNEFTINIFKMLDGGAQ